MKWHPYKSPGLADLPEFICLRTRYDEPSRKTVWACDHHGTHDAFECAPDAITCPKCKHTLTLVTSDRKGNERSSFWEVRHRMEMRLGIELPVVELRQVGL